MMGGFLARLKQLEASGNDATKPTKPPQGDEKKGFVGFVAPPQALFNKLVVDEVLDEVAHALSAGVIDSIDAERARQSIAVHCSDPKYVDEWRTLIRWCMATQPGPAGPH